MFTLTGKYGTAVIMIDDVEKECISQIVEFLNHPAFTNQVAIMPDTHSGKGSVIGFTMPMTDKIIPNTIGVDINCGMKSMKLGATTFEDECGYITSEKDKDVVALIDRPTLDRSIRSAVPFGTEVHTKSQINMERDFPWKLATELNRKFVMAFNAKFNTDMKVTAYSYKWFESKCKQIGMNVERAVLSLGTLGGGNHFIEVGRAQSDGSIWITIHTGSRQFGKCICEYWQNEPIRRKKEENQKKLRESMEEIKKTHIGKDISNAIAKLKHELNMDENKGARSELSYLTGEDMQGYLTDMLFTSVYADVNRSIISNIIRIILDVQVVDMIETTHNFIDFNDFIIRKGAISAYKGQRCLIPFNMEDGILVCEGKSNPDWNYSAPHGAGRVMSRAKAKVQFSSEVSADRMKDKDIYTSAVPVDEVKEAYKDPKIIEDAIGPTVDIIDRLIPIMNLKDGKTEGED